MRVYVKWNFGENYEKGYDIIENHRQAVEHVIAHANA